MAKKLKCGKCGSHKFVFTKEDLQIDLANPVNDACLYKIPYSPEYYENGVRYLEDEGEEFYMRETKKHGTQFYRFYFGEDGVNLRKILN